jgi:predicted nucleotidyltransferase
MPEVTTNASYTTLAIMISVAKRQLFDRLKVVLLQAVPDLWAIYAYGSVVNNTERADSDLDLGLLMPPGKNIPDLLGLRATLSAIAGREVDISDLRQAGTVLQKEVLAKGIELYSANREQTLVWEATALSEYADHQFKIRGILNDFKRTGIGYHQ